MKRLGVFLGSDPGRGGMFQYSLAILEALSRLPQDRCSTVAAFFNPAWKSYVEPLGFRTLMLAESGHEPFTLGRLWRTAMLPVTWWRRFLWKVDPVARALVRERCDAWVFPGQDHWSYLAPVPAISSIHDLMHRYEPQFPEVSRWGRYTLREYRFRNMCRFSDAVVVESNVGRKQVVDCYGVDENRLFVLPYVPPRYIFESGRSPDFDKRYKLPARFVFYPAQFWLHKNHERLLEALAIVRHSCPDIALVLAGPKSHQYKHLARRVVELGLDRCVTFVDYVPDTDLSEFYRRARALVMPTFFGPTNIPPLEAFVCGCPVATSDIYGMADQVGDAALLFNPSAKQEIADAVRRLWLDEDLRKQLIARGHERATKWGQSQFAEAFREVLAQITVSGGKLSAA